MDASSFNHQIFHFKSPPYQDNPFFLPHTDPCVNIRFLFPQSWLSENQKGEGQVIAIAYWTEEHTGAQNVEKASLGPHGWRAETRICFYPVLPPNPTPWLIWLTLKHKLFETGLQIKDRGHH